MQPITQTKQLASPTPPALPPPSPLPAGGDEIAALQDHLETLDATGRLRWAAARFGDRAAIGTSFQGAGIVALHLAAQAGLRIHAFTLDTGLLFPETLALKAELEARLGLVVETLAPAFTLDAQAREFGPRLWESDPDLCCELRKVQPLQEKLAALDCWITGVRREQSDTRATTRVLELNEDASGHTLWKLNPLADWTREQVQAHLRDHALPWNKLLDRGYRSIGCAPCTRPTADGDGTGERAGRWTGFGKKECGIHTFLKNKN
ncbi:MAG: phosphoadenylyl-sulfate reductase [Puniceicoccales bacterium]|jgi:phosphoadenosine phosphosulfate reductase|nr:phosphoadenylyl-sulfate reductase [Puniceicoccales bacterium]